LEHDKSKSEKELISDLIYSIQNDEVKPTKDTLSSDDIDRVVLGIISCTKAIHEEYDELTSYRGSYEKYQHMQEAKMIFRSRLISRFDEDTLYAIALRLEDTYELNEQSIKYYTDSIRDELYRGIVSKMTYADKTEVSCCQKVSIDSLYKNAFDLAGFGNNVFTEYNEWEEKVKEFSSLVYTCCSFNQANKLMNKIEAYYGGVSGYRRDNGRGYWMYSLKTILQNNYRDKVIDVYFDNKYSIGQKKYN